MTEQERLFETFGELMYVIAMADGVIQPDEETALNEILKNHPWASEIKWSFDYEKNKGRSVEEVYNEVLDFCQHYGPTVLYGEMIDVMHRVATASNGIDSAEEKAINAFSKDLVARFQADLDKIK